MDTVQSTIVRPSGTVQQNAKQFRKYGLFLQMYERNEIEIECRACVRVCVCVRGDVSGGWAMCGR